MKKISKPPSGCPILYATIPPKVEYCLTEKGRDVEDIFLKYNNGD